MQVQTPATTSHPPTTFSLARTDEADRPYAYMPPQVQQPGVVVEWHPPTLRDILIDLGLRLVEVGVQSIASEIAYFFTRRRFIPPHMRP